VTRNDDDDDNNNNNNNNKAYVMIPMSEQVLTLAYGQKNLPCKIQ
jgi:hypothetical protein